MIKDNSFSIVNGGILNSFNYLISQYNSYIILSDNKFDLINPGYKMFIIRCIGCNLSISNELIGLPNYFKLCVKNTILNDI